MKGTDADALAQCICLPAILDVSGSMDNQNSFEICFP